MQTRARDSFTTSHTEGGLLPSDLLQRILAGDRAVGGVSPESYHLAPGERINEAAARAWSRLSGAWSSFRDGARQLPDADLATTLTRERWLLVLFQELGYGRLVASKSVELDGKSYAVSHSWQSTPIHLVGFRIDLDRRTAGVAGAARTSPHSLVQELLNRSPERLWGFVSNGLSLRILRDNVSLTRQAYVEFDLESMMDGEAYSDFVLLWMLCHQSRVEGERLEDCWLEKWTQTAKERGTRALEGLRQGVEEAIRCLGSGFLVHPSNQALRERLRTGALTTQDYYHQVLRLVYRLLFLLVAEDRGLLLAPDAAKDASELYSRHYSMARLRYLAQRRRGTRHHDLYRGLRVVMQSLGEDKGCTGLGLPALGSFLWSPDAISDVGTADITNSGFLETVRRLSVTQEGEVLRQVDYRNLGSEELGSVYESLLELHPDVNLEAGSFMLTVAAGHERKSTGSYYTPESLVRCLLDSALDPVLNEATQGHEPERAILSLRVCDPACGSGHFLLAAAHRLSKRLAAVRTGDEEPSPEATRTALRDVIGRCIYGVDLNPMAVELCKVALWMEALEPGKPLSFLDHRILCGNSLLGTTPALIEQGIPDEAFTPIEGDDKAAASALRKQNKEEREGQTSLFAGLLAEPAAGLGEVAEALDRVAHMDDTSIDGVRRKERAYRDITESEALLKAKLAADAWCAAFVWHKERQAPLAPTQDVFLRLRQDAGSIPQRTREEVEALARQYAFFHWHVALPDVFWSGGGRAEPGSAPRGFDVVLGNPPWEHTELKEKEWLAARRPDIAGAPTGAERKRRIAALVSEDPLLFAAFCSAKRAHDGVSFFIGASGRYPLCGRGRINTYAVFAELMRELLAPVGRVGCIVPSGIATDDTTKLFFRDLTDTRSLVSLYDFENRKGLFPGVHRSYRFCLLTLAGRDRPVGEGAEFTFFAHAAEDLRDEQRRFVLSTEDIALVNPNTRTCPIFRTRRDAEITKAIYRRVPVLVKDGSPEENPWGITFKQGLFNMTSDSHLFRTREELESQGFRLEGNVFRKESEAFLPLYEGKMMGQFDHRAADVVISATAVTRQGQPDPLTASEHADPDRSALPRYWVSRPEVWSRLEKRRASVFLGFTDVTSPTNARSMLATLLPVVGVGHTSPLVFPSGSAPEMAVIEANLNAFCFDYVGRQKLGGIHYTYFILKQLPLLPPSAYEAETPWLGEPTRDWIVDRVLELTFTAYDMRSLAADLGCDGEPFLWDEARRHLLRCELDAAFFHLYRIDRPDVDHIMETFPIIKRGDERVYGEYRTKRLVLEMYDEMAEAIGTGEPYETRLDPPPADACLAHSPTSR